MGKLIFHEDKITDMESFLSICPFGALSCENGKVSASAACKMCRLCVKNGPSGAAVFEEDVKETVDKRLWNGITVFVDHEDGKIHPVTFELIGKARELAGGIGHKVYAIFIGSGIGKAAEELLYYGVDEVFVYDDPGLKHYIPNVYTTVFCDFIEKHKPCAILVGATTVGRELAPRVAARCKTGLTADCTELKINDTTDLVQIRPAFGGNIMAQILTPNNRPQLATVRYKVMTAPKKSDTKTGKITRFEIGKERIRTTTEVLSIQPIEKLKTIESADVIVAAGRGVKSKEDLALLQKLADVLGGELACTRPLVECGWMDARRQIGLSGRTVRPKLIVTCGVSGAIQFVAGMNHADCIFAINKDEKAPIFKTANYGIVGDLYEIVPKLIAKIGEGRS